MNPLRNVCILLLTLPASFAVVHAEEIFIRASQIGYRPQDVKIAVAFSSSGLPDFFSVVATNSGAEAFLGKTRAVTGVKWGQFENHVELDFTALKAPGRYVLRVGESKSLPFTIGAGAYGELPDELLEFMREQRCGYNPWLGAACHQLDGRTAYGPLTYGTYLDVRGGWHDAADLLKYLLTSGNATAQMLLAVELGRLESEVRSPKSEVRSPRSKASSLSSDHFNALGKAFPNAVPDILDEARWGLDWMLKLHPASDQLYHQVADDRDHIGRRLPQNEIADYGWGKGGARVVYFADGQPQGLRQYKSASTGMANLAGRYAAAMALAYQIWKDDAKERPFAERCLRAGKEVYELGRAKEGVQQGNSYSAPEDSTRGAWTVKRNNKRLRSSIPTTPH